MRIIRIAGVVLLATIALRAIPIPPLKLDRLTNSADQIVLGNVISLTDNGRITFRTPAGEEKTGRSVHGVMQVDQTLKGQAGLSQIEFNFVVPDAPNKYGSVLAHSYEMLFLRRLPDGRFQFASPYYPAIHVNQNVPVTKSDAIGRVVEQLAGAIESASSSEQQRLESIFAVSSSDSTEALHTLERALAKTGGNTRLRVASALLEHNDILGLNVAAEALIGDVSNIPYDIAHNLRYALAQGVKDERALPLLKRLMTSHDAETRRAAVSALWHLHSWSAVAALSSALWDTDQETRYYAVVGLAEITGQDAWRPLLEDLTSNESRYLAHWREWARKNNFAP